MHCAFCNLVFALAERKVRYGKLWFHDPHDKSCLLLWKQRRKEHEMPMVSASKRNVNRS